ncbi:hypothetical protein D3C72_1214430 [compost metagenome]
MRRRQPHHLGEPGVREDHRLQRGGGPRPAPQPAQVRAARSDLLRRHVSRPGAGGDLARRGVEQAQERQALSSAADDQRLARGGADQPVHRHLQRSLPDQAGGAEDRRPGELRQPHRAAEPLVVWSLPHPLLRAGGALRSDGAGSQQLQGGQQQHGSPCRRCPAARGVGSAGEPGAHRGSGGPHRRRRVCLSGARHRQPAPGRGVRQAGDRRLCPALHAGEPASLCDGDHGHHPLSL